MQKLNFFQIAGIFFTILVLFIWSGSIISSVIQSAKTGDYSHVLKTTGGRIFALDHTLKQETDILLLEEENRTDYIMFFHFGFAIGTLFIFFIFGYLIFRFGNWLTGLSQFSPATDIALVILVILIFFLIEFLYTAIVLKETIIPLTGVYYFIKNIPKIFANLFGF